MSSKDALQFQASPQPIADGSEQQDVTSDEYEDAERNYNLRSPKFWAIVIAMYMSAFLVAVDRSIIAVAVPKITDEFNSISDAAWYGSAYTLACACFNPISGRVYQLYPVKITFLLAVVVFEVGSALCGAAPTSSVLILGRSIAGLGSAFVLSGAMIILQPLVPIRKRPVFVSVFGLSFGLASVTGPIFGGALTDRVSWRWCFYINLPLGALFILAVFFLFHPESKPRDEVTLYAQIKRLDPLGILFFVPSMVCLMLALQWGGSIWPWSDPRIIGLFITFGLLFAAFVTGECLLPENAMAPARVALNRSMAGTMLYLFLASAGWMTLIYYLTYWFQAIQGTSAQQAGIRAFPMVIPFILVGILAATFTQAVKSYIPPMLFAPFPCAIAAGLLTTLTPSSSPAKWIGYQILFGFGIGCGYQNSQLAPHNVLPRADVPLGVGLIYFVQQLGGAIGLAIGQNILSSSLVASLSKIEGLDVQAILDKGALNLFQAVPKKELAVVTSAYNRALTRVFLFTAVATATMIIGVFIMKWVKLKDGPRKSTTSAATIEEK